MATKASKMEKNVESILETVIFIKKAVEKIDERVDDVESGLGAKIDAVSVKVDSLESKFGAFENNKVDKRRLLETRVDNIEKHLGFKKPATV